MSTTEAPPKEQGTKMGGKTAKMTSNMPPRRPRWPRRRLRWPHMHPRLSKMASRWFKTAQYGDPRVPLESFRVSISILLVSLSSYLSILLPPHPAQNVPRMCRGQTREHMVRWLGQAPPPTTLKMHPRLPPPNGYGCFPCYFFLSPSKQCSPLPQACAN